MELESIKKIVEAEKEAENKKQAAKQRAKIILDQAEASKKTNLDYFKNNLNKKEEELQKQKEEEISKMKLKSQAETNEKIQDLNTTAEERLDQAVKQIFEKVVKI